MVHSDCALLRIYCAFAADCALLRNAADCGLRTLRILRTAELRMLRI
uniref:Ribonuclease P n=1 Tax=Globodera pallida TaxID=36090 RepID=A0A183CRU8_GLOPA